MRSVIISHRVFSSEEYLYNPPGVAELIEKIILIRLFDHQKDRTIDQIVVIIGQRHSIKVGFRIGVLVNSTYNTF